MEPKFSVTFKEIIKNARTEALSIGNDRIHNEHLLLGILDSQRENSAKLAFARLDVNLHELRKLLIEVTEEYHKDAVSNIDTIPLTKSAERSIKNTYPEAKKFNSATITTFHLLLSILKDEKSNLSNIFQNKFGVDYELATALGFDSSFLETSNIEGVVEAYLTPSSSPLSLIFDTAEYSNEEIKEIILLFSELYSAIGGDHLQITGMNQFEQTFNLA